MHRSIVCTILFTTLLFTTPQIVVADCPPQWNYAFGQVGMNSSVTALCVYAGKLHAGGFFTTAGGVSANRVARWEGANWQPLGTGVTGGSVWCVTEFNGELIAGGFFTTAGGVSVSNIARWNGTSWQAMGAGLNNFVWALAVHNGQLYAGGDFTASAATSLSHVARWNGTAWQPVGFGVFEPVHSFASHNTNLVAGGLHGLVSQWNGSNWQSLPGLGDGTVYSLASIFGLLFAGGDFPQKMSMWNGSWAPFGAGTPNGTVLSMVVHNGELYVAGQFTSPGSRIARTDTWSWFSMTTGLNATAVALTNHNGLVIAAGDFTTAGGQTSNRIAAWGMQAWQGPPGGVFNNALNWNTATAPSSSSAVTFGTTPNSVPFSVLFTANVQTSSLCVTNQSPQFNLNGTTYTVTGDVSIGTGQLAISNGLLATASTTIGTVNASVPSLLSITNATLSSPVIKVGFFDFQTLQDNRGTLAGSGSIIGSITNRGTVSPGGPTGLLTVTGNYSQDSLGTLQFSIGPSQYSQMSVSGNATLGGTMRVQLVDGALPQSGQFNLLTTGGTMTGSFGALLLPFIGEDALMSVQYASSANNGSGVDGAGGVDGGGVTIVIGTPAGSPDFGDPQSFGLAGDPTGISDGDVGPAVARDIALSVAASSPNTPGNVLILLNQGNGAAFTPVTIQVGRNPSGIVSARLADGVLDDDFAIPNKNDNNVTVLFHDPPAGSANFTAVNVPVGNAPSAISAGNFRGAAGGNLIDLVVTNEGADTIMVLRNNGNRTFTPQTAIPVGDQPRSIASANIAGDATDDLVVVNFGSDSVTLLTNNGSGVFATSSPIAVGDEPVHVSPADLDNDRDLDLVVSNLGGGSLSLLINQGGGSLTASAMLPVDGAPTSADAWDMDADGDVDLAVVVTDSLLGEPVIRLLRNDSTPGQIAFTLFNPIGQGENPKLVNGADVSGDSQDDLIAVNASASPFADRLVGGSSPSMTIRPALVGIPGDITGDGHVNVNDLLAVINHWGTCPVPPAACTGDISPPPMGNGVVNVNDLLLVINNWG